MDKLSLNGQKTCYIKFHRARIKLTSYSSNSVMGDSIITATNEIKHIGVIIDNKITWITHITYVKNKVSNGIGIMFKAGNYLKRNTLINLYHSISKFKISFKMYLKEHSLQLKYTK